MEKRLSLITLGVADVGRAQRFYESLGWELDGGVDNESDHVAFFQAPGMIVALWDRGKLAKDSCVSDPGGWGGVTLAYNVRSPEEVDAVIEEARAAGAGLDLREVESRPRQVHRRRQGDVGSDHRGSVGRRVPGSRRGRQQRRGGRQLPSLHGVDAPPGRRVRARAACGRGRATSDAQAA